MTWLCAPRNWDKYHTNTEKNVPEPLGIFIYDRNQLIRGSWKRPQEFQEYRLSCYRYGTSDITSEVFAPGIPPWCHHKGQSVSPCGTPIHIWRTSRDRTTSLFTHIGRIVVLLCYAVFHNPCLSICTYGNIWRYRPTVNQEVKFCQMLFRWTKNSLHFINIWDTVTYLVPLCSVH